jgi:serine/threonine protein kinase
MPTAPTSAPELLNLIRRSGVVAPALLTSLADLALPDDPQQAAALLVAQGLLTQFQAQQLLAGRHKGFRLGPYVVKDILGRGGMGAVYLAEHQELKRKVAVKILVPGKDEDQRLALERFLREARSAAALDHPNIVRIFDVAWHNEVPYLVMEFVDGQTLQQVLDTSGPIPYAAATDYIAQAAAGLQHAHEKGFVHRDIKPGNLMLDRTGTIKLLDMGLARSAGSQDQLTERLDHGAVVGTADFIAPEQALNQSNIDGRADIYSLGATFFALLIGKPPFEGNTTQKLLQHQLRSAPKLTTLDKSLPKDLSAVVARMLAKKPTDRYQSPAELIAALKPWLSPNSRVWAGLSHTTLGSESELQGVLFNAKTTGSSLRLGRRSTAAPGEPNTEAVNPGDPGLDTGLVATSATTRELRRSAGSSQKKQLLLYGATVVLFLGVGALAAWLVTGESRSTHEPASELAAQSTAPPLGTQSVVSAAQGDTARLPEAIDSPTEPVLFNLAAVDLPKFHFTRTGFDHTGGDPPPRLRGVTLGGYKKETHSAWTCAMVDGRQALSFTNLNDVISAQVAIELESPEGLGLTLEPGQQVRLRVTYQTAGETRGQMYFQTYADWSLIATQPLASTQNGWSTVELVATRGQRPIRCVIETLAAGAGNTISLRTITVTAVPKPSSPSPQTAGRATDLNKWVEGSVIYSLDVQAIPPFRVIKEQFTRTSGEAETLPVGVGCQSWREGAIGEFRCEKLHDIPVLRVTNLNDLMSGQFYFQLEGEMKLPLQPGKAYRVKVGYSTANEAAGAVHIQTTPGYRNIASVFLPRTDDKWKWASLSFIRPPAQEGVEVRMVIDNTTVGEGNTLSIRSLQLVELVPPLE